MAINQRDWVALRRIDRKLGRPVDATPIMNCLEHPWLRADRVLRGIGPLCSSCIATQVKAPKHPQRRARVCGCGDARTYCPFAARLYRRVHVAHAKLLDTPESDQDQRARLGRAYSQMLLALKRHQEEI
jgi:hypothetical protein